jgi:protoporphyrinogen oxidase
MTLNSDFLEEYQMEKVVIIGAGLTGLSAAYHLQQTRHSYDLYEQHETVGGLTRSVQENGFTFDYTGHFLHSNNAYFSSIIDLLFQGDSLDTIARKAFIFSHGTYTAYPFQSNLSGLPLNVICECIEGIVRKSTSKTAPKNLREWLLKGFGRGMCKHFFFPYNKKILSYPLHKAMPEQGGRFVPNTTLNDIVRNLATTPEHSSAGYNATFLYPKSGGIQQLANRLSSHLEKKPATSHAVASIDPYKKTVLFSNGNQEKYDVLISTMPLDTLLKLTTFGSASSLSHQRTNLVCNTVINLNLGINRPTINDKHWIYFPEKKYSFYRLGFWSSISESMAPQGTSSLYGELSLLNPTQKDIHQKIKRAKREIMALFGIQNPEICVEKILTLNHAYVIYNEWRKNNLESLLSTLSDQFGIYSVGRFGGWKYSSMQEAILDGQHVVQEIGKRTQTHTNLFRQSLIQP